jgi:hypothetical protein
MADKKELIFTFVTERGRFRMTHKDYVENAELRALINDRVKRVTLFLGLTIISFPHDWLATHPSDEMTVRALSDMLEENPLRFFLPSQLYRAQAKDFLNDLESEVKALIAGNRNGKTCHSIVDVLLDLIPTDPSWEIFTHHGVTWRPFAPPRDGHRAGFATSDWNMCERVLWPEIKKWIPKYELGELDPRRPNAKELSVRNRPSFKLECGTECFMFCYEQKQGAFEGQVLTRMYWDEQGEEPKWDGIDERFRTTRGRHVHGLTPHHVDGRVDTGARSWLHKMLTGQITKGRSVKCYTIHPDDVPDWVYPVEEKRKAYEKHIAGPKRQKNVKALKEGRSRYYGEWHDVSGLVFDEFDESVHLVDPFSIPDRWTRYRAVDHGVTNPTACLWLAVSPEGDWYFYREYYKSGLTIGENANNIILASGNERVVVGSPNERHASVFPFRYEEKVIRERYHQSKMDKRSFNTKEAATGLTIGTMYQWCGLNLSEASGQPAHLTVPLVKEYMRIDPDRVHPATGKKGAPRIYIFRTLQDTIKEVKNYAWDYYRSSKSGDRGNAKEFPVEKDDHLIACIRYMVQIPPRYIDDFWAFYESPLTRQRSKPVEEREDWEDKPRLAVDPYTGY